MPNVTFEDLRNADFFRVLGDLFPDRERTLALLEDTGADTARLPSFGDGTVPATYWRAVCRDIGRGMFAFGLGELLAEAAARFPGNPDLARFASGAGTATTRVLCLQAAPSDVARLQLDAEYRLIATALRGTPMAHTAHPATRIGDIIATVLAAEPTIVHFSGHGSPDGSLLFEDDARRAVPVGLDALGRVLGGVGDLECVLLNSCYTAAYARALTPYARVVAGSDRPLPDRDALAFADGFYTALAAGRDIPGCYRMGVAAIGLADGDTDAMRIVERAPAR